MLRRKAEMVERHREHVRDGKGVMRDLILLSPEETNGRCSNFTRLLIDPGCSIGMHAHVENAEIYYVLSGEVVTWEKNEEIILREGDITYCGNGDAHFIENRTDTVAEVLAVIMN